MPSHVLLPDYIHPLTVVPMPSDAAIRRALLELTSDRRVHRLLHAVDSLADRFQLTPAERSEKTTSGNKRFYDRVSFASLDLRQRDLLEAVGHGYFRITPRGCALLEEHADP